MSDSSSAIVLRDEGHLEPARPYAPVIDFSIGTYADKWQLAEMLSRSDMVPDAFRNKPGNILIAADLGASLGLRTSQALQNIAVINGRPCVWGDGLLGIVKRSPLCEWFKETEIGTCGACKKSIYRDPGDKDREPTWMHSGSNAIECADGKAVAELEIDDKYGFRATAKRRGDPNIIINEFTIENARNAGLLDKKGPWKEYGPRRMCRMRARSWTARDAFPDTLKGLSMREEIVDVPNEVRAAIVTAPTRTEALAKALDANAAVALAVAKAHNTDIPPIDESIDDPQAAAQRAARGLGEPTEENLQAALDNAAAADPDFAKKTPQELREYIKAQSVLFDVKPWYVADIEKATPEGRLVRKNVGAVLRAIRERSLRDQLGIAPPKPQTPPATALDEDASEKDDRPAQSGDATIADAKAEPASATAPETATELPPFTTMTSAEIHDYLVDVAFNIKMPEQRLNIIIRVHTDGGALTAENVHAVLADIKKWTGGNGIN